MSYSSFLYDEYYEPVDESFDEECYLGDCKIDRPSRDGWEAASFAKEDFATAGDGIYRPRMIPPFPRDTSGFSDDHNSTPDPEEEFVDIITIPARNAEEDQWTEEETPLGEDYYYDDDDEYLTEGLTPKQKKLLKIGAAVAGATALGAGAYKYNQNRKAAEAKQREEAAKQKGQDQEEEKHESYYYDYDDEYLTEGLTPKQKKLLKIGAAVAGAGALGAGGYKGYKYYKGRKPQDGDQPKDNETTDESSDDV